MSGTRNSRVSSIHINSSTSQTSTSASPRTRGVTRRVLVPATLVVPQRTTSAPSTSGSSGITTRSSLSRISLTVATPSSSQATRRANASQSTLATSRTTRPRASVAAVRLGVAAATACSPSSGTSVAGRPLTKRRLALATQPPVDASSIKRTKEPKKEMQTVLQEKEEVIAVTKRASYIPNIACPICMIDLGNTGSSTEQDTTATSIGNCGHVICYACATRIYTLFARCPICNEKINLKNFRKLYFS